MAFKRAATILGLGVALAAWLAAAATSGNRDAIVRPPVRLLPVDARGAELAGQIARMRERLRPSATPRQPGRNLFSYSSPRQTRPTPAVTTPPALSEAASSRPAPPFLQLSGIAEDPTPSGIVRTAIISGRGQLFLVKEGEPVTDRYRVVKVSSEVVELADVTDGTALRLALK